MRYINSCNMVAIGDYVKLSHHIDAEAFIVKRIDTLNECVYLVAINSYFGQWVDSSFLLKV